MKSHAFISLCLALFLSGCAAASEGAPGEIDKGRSYVNAFMSENGIPGASVAVYRHGSEVWSEGFGIADVENDVPVASETLMRIGSISKPMTAAAVLRLNEKGILGLDDNVLTLVPEMAERTTAITYRQLGGHIGGIRSYLSPGEELTCQHYVAIGAALDRFDKDPLAAPPGSKFIYSSYGYVLLSAAGSRASGHDYEALMGAEVWTPLELRHVALDDVTRIVPGRARYYERTDDGTLRLAPYTDDSYKYAAAGLLANSDDLARFGAAVLGGDYLSAASRETLFTSQTTANGTSTGYGFGWFVGMKDYLDARKDKLPPPLVDYLFNLFKDRQIIWHSGTTKGSTSMLLLSPDTGVVIAITTNLDGIEPQIYKVALELESTFSQ